MSEKFRNQFEIIEERQRPENDDRERQAQAIGFIRQAMFSRHTEPNFHTPVAKEDLRRLNEAETASDFKEAISVAYSDPGHILEDAARHFEEQFPGNGRNGEGLASVFDTQDNTIGAKMVNIRTEARNIIRQLREEFSTEARELVVSSGAGS